MNKAQSDKIWYQWSRLVETAPARFRRYGELDRSKLQDHEIGDSALDGLAKVAWNTALAEALTPMLQAAEVGLRNWMDKAIAEYLVGSHANPREWLMHPPIWMHPYDVDLRNKAVTKLADQVAHGGRATFGHNDIVATASFSLWSNMIQGNDVWSALTAFKKGELTKGTDRKSLHKLFDDVRNLRNRAYHLEPLFSQPDLRDIYDGAVKYLKILEPRLSTLMAGIDRFDGVYGGGDGWRILRERLYVHYGLDKLEDPPESEDPPK